MREKKFKVPVVVVPGRIDRERVVEDVHHAAIVLLHEWPLPASRAKQKAMKACLDVLRGNKPPSVARSAFIEAAKEARILQEDRSLPILD
ncbi:MAG: DUF982 domain-containing protein [Rhizobiales bacterium]|jgi:hypothetical protein|nr:DUF982 domain-containing protein [Hyphomicrobiales bacterium]